MSTASIPCITSEDRAKLTAAKLAFWPRAKTEQELNALYSQAKVHMRDEFAKKPQPWRDRR